MNEDDLEALRQEFYMFQGPGWAVFMASLLEKFHEDSEKLCFGSYKDDRDRLQSEGRCQLFKWISDHQQAIQSAWQAMQEERAKADEPVKEEGGDLGVHYEAAQ